MLDKYHIPQPDKNIRQKNIDYQELNDRAIILFPDCDHNFEARTMQAVNGTRYRLQCSKCFARGGVIAKAKVRFIAGPFDTESADHAYDTLRQQRCAWVQAQMQTIEQNYNNTWWDWYNQYLCSDVWYRKRQMVLNNAGYVCKACGINHAEMVHHLTYARVGQEPLFDLVAVCRECHSDLHNMVTS